MTSQVKNYCEVFVALLDEDVTLSIGEHTGLLAKGGDWQNAVRVNMQVCKAIKARAKYFNITRHMPTEDKYVLNENGVQVGLQFKAQGYGTPFA